LEFRNRSSRLSNLGNGKSSSLIKAVHELPYLFVSKASGDNFRQLHIKHKQAGEFFVYTSLFHIRTGRITKLKPTCIYGVIVYVFKIVMTFFFCFRLYIV